MVAQTTVRKEEPQQLLLLLRDCVSVCRGRGGDGGGAQWLRKTVGNRKSM